MQTYLKLVEETLNKGVLSTNRTDQRAYTIIGWLFRHDMAEGFPLLTTKQMAFKAIAAELEFFIKGLSDKRWLQERNCHIWDPWCNPQRVAHISDPVERKTAQANESELGPIYGKQWRAFSAPHTNAPAVDQLQNLLTELKANPTSRRLVVSAWNPLELSSMALPPCHMLFHVTVLAGKLSLTWFQRSADLMVGVPFNIASYALLLQLLAKASGYEPGTLVGTFSNVHIYEGHKAAAHEQLKRLPKPLPQLQTPHFSSLFDWSYTDTHLVNYEHHPKLKFEVAV